MAYTGFASSRPAYVPVLGNSTYDATLFLVYGQMCTAWVSNEIKVEIEAWLLNNVLRGPVCALSDVYCVLNTNISCGKQTDRASIQ